MTEVHVHGPHATVRAPGLEDEVAVEEPLESRVDGRSLAVTMRTPGHDEELALVAALPDRLRQPTFARTGGLHATGLFTADGELVCAREDVGVAVGDTVAVTLSADETRARTRS
jgi:formate dehydrogenase assembly factor FdhD